MKQKSKGTEIPGKMHGFRISLYHKAVFLHLGTTLGLIYLAWHLGAGSLMLILPIYWMASAFFLLSTP